MGAGAACCWPGAEEGVMEVRERPDGLIELDWKPPRGPYVVVTKAQWDSLVAELKLIAKVGL